MHGVTTVIGGNCGFTLAPLNAEDADYIRRMMAKVEGMPLAALEQGVPWNWSTFAEYLDALDGNLGVNAGFLVGHCALRRKVLGASRAEEVATDEEIAAMRALLADSLAAGGLGFSSSQSRTHSDGDGRPISSRHADRREMLAFCAEVAAHEGTTLEYITNGCLDSFTPEEVDLMTAMSVTAQRPLNWNVLTVDARSAERIEHQLSASSAASAAGGRIVALTMPTLVPMNMSFRTHCALFLIPGWGEVMGLPDDERIDEAGGPRCPRHARRARPEQGGRRVPRALRTGAPTSSATPTPRRTRAAPSAPWPTSPPNAGPRPSTPCSTSCSPTSSVPCCGRTPMTATKRPGPCGRPSGAIRRAMVGGSDAGAHLDRMCGSNYPTAFLADCLRGRRLVPVEQAVHMMTGQPAALFGLRERGLVREGYAADLLVFDPETVASEPARLVHDLPGDTPRLYAGSHGVVRVLVNGVETVRDGTSTGAVPGTLLRSGRDTASVVPAPA